MRESRSSGSVGGEGGNALTYPAGDKLPTLLKRRRAIAAQRTAGKMCQHRAVHDPTARIRRENQQPGQPYQIKSFEQLHWSVARGSTLTRIIHQL